MRRMEAVKALVLAVFSLLAAYGVVTPESVEDLKGPLAALVAVVAARFVDLR